MGLGIGDFVVQVVIICTLYNPRMTGEVAADSHCCSPTQSYFVKRATEHLWGRMLMLEWEGRNLVSLTGSGMGMAAGEQVERHPAVLGYYRNAPGLHAPGLRGAGAGTLRELCRLRHLPHHLQAPRDGPTLNLLRSTSVVILLGTSLCYPEMVHVQYPHSEFSIISQSSWPAFRRLNASETNRAVSGAFFCSGNRSSYLAFRTLVFSLERQEDDGSSVLYRGE
jgi:hypothetical protein